MYLMVGLMVFMNVIRNWGWVREPRKMKKMSSMKRFQKQTECRNVRIMVRSSLPMNRLALGGAILIPMDVPRTSGMCVSMKLKVPCFSMKSRIMRTMWGGGQFLNRRCLYSSMK